MNDRDKDYQAAPEEIRYVAGAKITTALIKAQAEMKPPKLNKTNPHYKSAYADLTSVIEAVKGPLNNNEIAFTQTTIITPEGGLILMTTLRHSSGEVIVSEWPLPSNANPQNMGSNLTYAKRYSLAAICGVSADEDDDAEAGVKEAAAGAKKQTAAQRDATKPQAKAPEQAATKLEPQAIDRPDGISASEWAGKFMQQIGLATNEAEIIAWHKANAGALSDLHEKALKISERVIAFVADRKKALAENAG